MAVSLKNYTLKYLILSVFVLITIWAAVFYAFILDEVYDNVDDGLKNQKIQIIREAYLDEKILNVREFGINQYRITPINNAQYLEVNAFKNEMVFMQYDDDMEPYRLLTTYFRDHNQNPYRLEIRTSTVEEDDLLIDLSTALIVLYIVLVISIYFLNRWILTKAFRPFDIIVEKISNYRFGKKADLQFSPTPISEFNAVEEGMLQMIEDNKKIFEQQKNFIGNASHELKTPISIINNKIDSLIENVALDEPTVEGLVDLKKNTDRMNRIVTALLTLSKIDNLQYEVLDQINLSNIVNDIIEEFEDYLSFKSLSYTLKLEENFVIEGNPDLSKMLVTNLLMNAIKYTPRNGEIVVESTAKQIVFKNTANDGALDDKIFERFYKNGTEETSTGLGLSIVESIVNQTNGLKIMYDFENNFHVFKLYKTVS